MMPAACGHCSKVLGILSYFSTLVFSILHASEDLCTRLVVGYQPGQAGQDRPEPAAGGGGQAVARHAPISRGAGAGERGGEGGVGAEAGHLP
jgi:hypothetical protein